MPAVFQNAGEIHADAIAVEQLFINRAVRLIGEPLVDERGHREVIGEQVFTDFDIAAYVAHREIDLGVGHSDIRKRAGFRDRCSRLRKGDLLHESDTRIAGGTRRNEVLDGQRANAHLH